MTAFKLITPPAAEPVTLADARAHARVDTTVDDTVITNLITAARQWAEQYTGRAFITQTWQLWLDMWPATPDAGWDGMREGPISGILGCNYMRLPRAPLASVTSVTYYDNNNNPTLWSSTNYLVDTISEPGRISPRMGSTWPVPGRVLNGIGIEYVAGYGDDRSDVPEVIKTAILQLAAHWYEHRGEAATAPTARGAVIMPAVPVPLVIQALLDPYRVRRLV